MSIFRNLIALATICAVGFGCAPTPDEPDEEPTETPDDAPAVEKTGQEGDITSYRVGEVDVVHMPTPANEVVAARLYLRGGTAMLDESTQGLERLALATATRGGTESTPKNEFNARLDAVGSSVGFTANRDFTGFSMRSVRDHFDETWELFEEAIFEPAFEDDEIELQRDRQLSNIRRIAENPNRLVSEVARDLTFEDHPYYLRQSGTEETVEAFTPEQVREWHDKLVAPERMLLVVVGNIESDELIDKVKARLGTLEPTGLDLPELPEIAPEAPAQRVEQMDVPTNYILGYFAAPTLGDDDYAALRLATQHLRDRLFEEVRTKRNLTYSVASSIGERGTNVGYLYVSAVDPKATIPVMLDEVDKLQKDAIDEQELEKVRNVFLTRHYTDQETNASIAGSLARAELIGGDWRISQRFRDDIMDVTPDDIKRVANAYIGNYQVGAVGDPDEVLPELFGVETEYAETVDEVEDLDPEDIEEAPEPEEPEPEPGEDPAEIP